jgi:hypothetical protein
MNWIVTYSLLRYPPIASPSAFILYLYCPPIMEFRPNPGKGSPMGTARAPCYYHHTMALSLHHAPDIANVVR